MKGLVLMIRVGIDRGISFDANAVAWSMKKPIKQRATKMGISFRSMFLTLVFSLSSSNKGITIKRKLIESNSTDWFDHQLFA